MRKVLQILCAAMLAFAFAACGEDPPVTESTQSDASAPASGSSGSVSSAALVPQRYLNGKIGNDVQFYADRMVPEGGAANARKRQEGGNPEEISKVEILEGKIHADGRYVEVAGFIDPDTRMFFLSGGTDTHVYDIKGEMDSGGNMQFGEIDRKVFAAGDWDSTVAPFEKLSADVSIPQVATKPELGLPPEYWGKWEPFTYQGSHMSDDVFVITPFGANKTRDMSLFRSDAAMMANVQVNGIKQMLNDFDSYKAKGVTIAAFTTAYGFDSESRYKAALEERYFERTRLNLFGSDFNFLECTPTPEGDGYDIIGYNRLYESDVADKVSVALVADEPKNDFIEQIRAYYLDREQPGVEPQDPAAAGWHMPLSALQGTYTPPGSKNAYRYFGKIRFAFVPDPDNLGHLIMDRDSYSIELYGDDAGGWYIGDTFIGGDMGTALWNDPSAEQLETGIFYTKLRIKKVEVGGVTVLAMYEKAGWERTDGEPVTSWPGTEWEVTWTPQIVTPSTLAQIKAVQFDGTPNWYLAPAGVIVDPYAPGGGKEPGTGGEGDDGGKRVAARPRVR